MDKITIIKKLRKDQKISQKVLCYGLCSIQTLSNIENDLCEIDTLLLDILLQRLGKSPDKLELILSQSEYYKIRIRDLIETLIRKKKKSKAEYLLNYYEQTFSESNNIQKMYCLRTRANIAYFLDYNLVLAKELILKALDLTMFGWKIEDLSNYKISTIEMENLLMFLRITLEQGDIIKADSIFNACIFYIRKYFTDDEYSKIFSKVAWLGARILLLEKHELQSLVLCEEAIENLRRKGISYFMLPLLKFMSSYYEKQGIIKQEWSEWYDCLKEINIEFGDNCCYDDDLFHNCYQREYHLDYEIIRGERLAKGYTQAELIDNIYQSPETLSRIETGKVSPTKSNFEQFMIKLGLNRKRYDGIISADSFEILELQTELDNQIRNKKYKDAEEMLNKLKENLDLSLIQNNQVIKYEEALIFFHTNKYSFNKLCKVLFDALYDTYSIKKDSKRYPLKTECILFSLLCNILFFRYHAKEFLYDYNMVIQTFLKSKTNIKHHYYSLGLLLSSQSFISYICKKNSSKQKLSFPIKYELLCGKAEFLAAELIFYTSIFGDTKEEENKKNIKVEQAYKISRLFYQNTYELWIKEKYMNLN